MAGWGAADPAGDDHGVQPHRDGGAGKRAFDTGRIHIDELCDPERVLHIDSKVLDQAEAREEAAGSLEFADENGAPADDNGSVERKLTKAEQAEPLRRTVDTVGGVDPGCS